MYQPLSLNPSKSKIMLLTAPNLYPNLPENFKIKICKQTLKTVSSAKNPGLILDNKLRFKPHVSALIRKAFGNLRIIYNVRQLLTSQQNFCLGKLMLLSLFNFADTVWSPCLNSGDRRRVQVIQNCV